MTTATDVEEPDPLSKIVESAKSGRLSVEEEKQAAIVVKQSLLDGKAAMTAAIEAMVQLPWIVGVEAVNGAWPELKVTARRQLLTGLEEQTSDQGRRLRLSLARGLFSTDVATTLKIAVSVCGEMKTADPGLTPRDRQIFANVFIGKGKPWLLHLPTADLKPAEADTIIHCGVATCFFGQCPPLTQLSLLQWINAAGRFSSLAEEQLDAIAKTVKRWNPKLQAQLRTSIPELPTVIEESLKPAPQAKLSEAVPQRTQEVPRREERARPQPSRLSNDGTAFDLNTALKQIESHVNSLRAELHHARNEMRRREDSGRPRGRSRRDAPPDSHDAGLPELGSLQRHNQQLEETVSELRQQLEELAGHHEDVATSMDAGDPQEQFKALLAIKLQKDFDDFRHLEKETPDEVFREHYRLLLEDVFNTLQAQGIVFGTH